MQFPEQQWTMRLQTVGFWRNSVSGQTCVKVEGSSLLAGIPDVPGFLIPGYVIPHSQIIGFPYLVQFPVLNLREVKQY